MADVLEATESRSDEGEADRCIDRAGFTRQQFDIFKHNFRESAASQQDTLLQTGFEQGFVHVRTAARRLARVRGALLALDSTVEVVALLEDVTSVLRQLDSFSSDAKGRQDEFSPANAKLPPFDAKEMELLLGADVPSVDGPVDPVSSFLSNSDVAAGLCKKRVDQLISGVDVLFSRFESVLHSRGLCNAFIYD